MESDAFLCPAHFFPPSTAALDTDPISRILSGRSIVLAGKARATSLWHFAIKTLQLANRPSFEHSRPSGEIVEHDRGPQGNGERPRILFVVKDRQAFAKYLIDENDRDIALHYGSGEVQRLSQQIDMRYIPSLAALDSFMTFCRTQDKVEDKARFRHSPHIIGTQDPRDIGANMSQQARCDAIIFWDALHWINDPLNAQDASSLCAKAVQMQHNLAHGNTLPLLIFHTTARPIAEIQLSRDQAPENTFNFYGSQESSRPTQCKLGQIFEQFFDWLWDESSNEPPLRQVTIQPSSIKSEKLDDSIELQYQFTATTDETYAAEVPHSCRILQARSYQTSIDDL